MAALTVLAIDGVLRTPVGDGVITAGQALYHGLAEVGPVALVCDDQHEVAEHWLRINGFTRHVYLVAPAITAPEDPGARRMTQIQELRTHQSDLGFLVESDPEVAAHCVRAGVPVLLLAHPRYSKPEFRPDHKAEIVPWDVLTSEVDRQRELRANDTRLGSLT